MNMSNVQRTSAKTSSDSGETRFLRMTLLRMNLSNVERTSRAVAPAGWSTNIVMQISDNANNVEQRKWECLEDPFQGNFGPYMTRNSEISNRT